MARPLRIEYPGALYHVTSRGNAKRKIFRNDIDRMYFLDLLGKTVTRYHWICHGYCLMDNHYHLVIETPEGNLSRGMKHLNGVYTQKYNWRYKKTGHILQGRFNAIIVDKDSYLLQLCRYVLLNPVRAKIVETPDLWRWSSYNAMTGKEKQPEYLTTDWVLGQFSDQKRRAHRLFKDFVMKGIHDTTLWKNVKGQIFLGEKEFIERCKRILGKYDALHEIPRSQRFADRPSLEHLFTDNIQQQKQERNNVIHDACIQYGYTLKEVADFLGIHYTTVSNVIRNHENDKN
ncbi:MAG: transposase [Syntrophorhabdaceae bacterium]|nr:transposase [Syntrophorhabdaceae bacterium]MDD5242647.1 transposase [Syntrophorhabdaceae bacterium]